MHILFYDLILCETVSVTNPFPLTLETTQYILVVFLLDDSQLPTQF